MSSVHCVVVWEFQSGGQWIPHTPGVTRTLERAHAKKLTRVVLSDADPALKGHHVNLRTLTQCRDMPDGGTTECLVRRSCYSVQSVGGRGVRWEWARLSSPPLPAELHYEPMPMEMQCSVESAWCSGAERVSHGGWALCPAGGLARRGAAVRLVRRAPQPPYPLTRQPPATAPPAPPPLASHVQDTLHHAGVYRCIPQQHTGSSVQAMAGGGGGTRALAADRKPNLARQILHNLNIFSSKPAVGPGDAAQLLEPQLSEVQLSEARLSEARLSEAQLSESGRTDTESGSTRSLRRHSVDTVSTYLSHESKDSMQRGSVGELLNCSGGSDDVFEARDDDSTDDQRDVCMDVDVDACMDGCAWWTRVSCPQWGAVCPVCMRALAGARGGAGGAAGGGGAVALVRCQHMLHHHCLAQLLRTAAAAAAHTDEAIYIECLVCGHAYSAGARRPPLPPPAPAPAPAPLPRAPAPAPAPAQPPGSMAWRLQHASLPQCAPHTAILVTYNFQSGIQGAGDPAPGEQYYAVGFPRHSVLPDDELGREVLSLLRTCWSRGALFCVRASRTTGREHVVAWRAPPPPAAPHHYLPPARVARLLRDVIHTLHALLDTDATQC